MKNYRYHNECIRRNQAQGGQNPTPLAFFPGVCSGGYLFSSGETPTTPHQFLSCWFLKQVIQHKHVSKIRTWPDLTSPTWPDLTYLRSDQGPTWPNGRDATGAERVINVWKLELYPCCRFFFVSIF